MKIPEELKGLWALQYAPRERALRKALTKDALERWNGLSVTRKITVIDRLQAQGLFGGE